MNRSPNTHFDRRPRPDRTSKRARATEAGIARGPGMLVAGVTAAIVFVIGQQLFPVRPRPAPPAPPAPASPAPIPPPAVPPPATAAADAASPAEGGAGATSGPDANAAAADATHPAVQPKEETPAPTKPAAEAAPKPSAEEAPSGAAAGGKPSEKQDKDLARESWRRNRPDISVSGSKTAIMIPIRGSIRGSDFKIVDKRRKVIVTLPKAVSMITLRVYNLKHPLFKKVWIDQDEANAQPADGTKLRFILGQTLDPQVEITDDFVRVTVRRPESAGEHSERRAAPLEEEAVPAAEKAAE